MGGVHVDCSDNFSGIMYLITSRTMRYILLFDINRHIVFEVKQNYSCCKRTKKFISNMDESIEIPTHLHDYAYMVIVIIIMI